MSRLTMFAPIRPKPIIPSCMTYSSRRWISCDFNPRARLTMENSSARLRKHGRDARAAARTSCRLFQFPAAQDERARRAVVRRAGSCRGAEFRDDPLGEHLPQLHAPLVKRVDAPDRALREDAMLVERDQLAERGGCEPLEQDRVGRPIALESAMRHE